MSRIAPVLFAALATVGLGGVLLLATASATAQSMDLSPDVPLNVGGVYVADHEVAVDLENGGVQVALVGGLPREASIDAYHVLPSGEELFSLDTAATLPGGVHAIPGDVVRWNGTAYSMEFDALAAGLSRRVNVDAVSQDGSGLWLSFDVAVSLPGFAAQDHDLVSYGPSGFSMRLDGAAEGIAPALDVDGVHLWPGGWLALSFDGSGRVGGVDFADEDVMLLDSTTGIWRMHADGSEVDPAWRAVDVEAVHFVPEPSAALSLAFASLGLALLTRLRRRPVEARIESHSRGVGERSKRISALVATALFALLGSSSASATDGVIEINQAAAVAGGITIADTPGFPVTLSDRGSYLLTSELNVPANTDGIVIQNEGITLDLNGFSIFGGGGTTGDGISAPAGARGVSVRNGGVRAMGGNGISLLGEDSLADGLLARGNGEDGIVVGDFSIVRNCRSRENGDDGIVADQSRIESNVVAGNEGSGIISTVSSISDNVVSENGSFGITATNGSTVRDNTIRSNASYGLHGQTSTGYGGNVLSNNNGGPSAAQVTATPVQIDTNLCSGQAC